MNGREPFGYVVSIEGARVTLNLKDTHRGHFASHRDGISGVTEVGGLFGVDGGTRLLVLRVRSLSFVEPREAHRAGVGSTSLHGEPLRHVEAIVAGSITRRGENLRFVADSLLSPALGAEAFPLSHQELAAILGQGIRDEATIRLGEDVRGGGSLDVAIAGLLGRHVAVLGGTGQGKSCFTAAAGQQLLKQPGARIVVFDINGEYEQALSPFAAGPGETKISILGGSSPTLRIPYVALGRHGLGRLLLPSEKTQRPALNFALESLQFVNWFPVTEGVGLAGSASAELFDDCRPNPSADAVKAIDILRRKSANPGIQWPNMRALGCLVADSYCLQQNTRGGLERNAFQYGNVAPLITRIRRYTEDPLFTSVINVNGGPPCRLGSLDWRVESSDLVDQIFGGKNDRWKLHIVNLRGVAHDLLPMVLGSLLELLAFEMFQRGQGVTHPTLLVLEEAHHYLRQVASSDDGAQHMLAYERLAKEGRKFGISLWISTQRPAEVSPTVLAQCGTWAVFRLTSEQDLRAVGAAGEWLDRQELDRIAGLPRQQAVVFGTSVAMPVRVVAPTANPVPKSSDPDFSVWASPFPVKPPTPSPISRSPVLADKDDDVPF
jgi:uncharacterized protein